MTKRAAELYLAPTADRRPVRYQFCTVACMVDFVRSRWMET